MEAQNAGKATAEAQPLQQGITKHFMSHATLQDKSPVQRNHDMHEQATPLLPGADT